MPIDYQTPAGQVRLLINDTTATPVFSDAEIGAFLTLEGDVVKLAAALALLTVAGDEALTSKVIRTQDLTTDGAKLAAELRAQAQVFRDQVEAEDFGFEIVPFNRGARIPELTEDPYDAPLSTWWP